MGTVSYRMRVEGAIHDGNNEGICYRNIETPPWSTGIQSGKARVTFMFFPHPAARVGDHERVLNMAQRNAPDTVIMQVAGVDIHPRSIDCAFGIFELTLQVPFGLGCHSVHTVSEWVAHCANEAYAGWLTYYDKVMEAKALRAVAEAL
jgi:hypothetical protein